jgi:hypothetical protein
MMSEHRPDKKITLEDLLQLKRAERPSADFWMDFERELRTRQLAAAVEKRRWWFALPRVLHGFSRYQVPVGAAAVLAVTFITLREYREPAFESAYTVPAPAAVLTEAPEMAVDEPAQASEARSIVIASLRPEAPAISDEVGSRSLAPAVPWSGLESGAVDQPRAMTPSARSIQANLAAAEPEIGRLLPGAKLSTPAKPATFGTAEPLAQLTGLRDARREPLFAYNAEIVADNATSDATRPTARIGSRISETELYDSVRRLSGGADRLTLRF